MEDKLLSAIRDKRPALGCFDLGTSPEYMEVMGYVGFDTVDDMAARVHRLYEHGVRVISLQPASVLFQFWSQELIQKASRHVPLAARPGGPVPR